MAKKKLRKKLVTAVIRFSREELDEVDYIVIAKQSNKELLNHLISMLEWYFDEYNK